MIKSHYPEANSRRADAEWSLVAIAHPENGASRTSTGMTGNHDPRPLWQRLDDEEDQQRVRRRRLMRYIRQCVFAAVVVVLFIWVVS
jgi:hypothetical protein